MQKDKENDDVSTSSVALDEETMRASTEKVQDWIDVFQFGQSHLALGCHNVDREVWEIAIASERPSPVNTQVRVMLVAVIKQVSHFYCLKISTGLQQFRAAYEERTTVTKAAPRKRITSPLADNDFRLGLLKK